MTHEYLKSKLLKSKNQEGDNNQSGPQSGPSNIMDLPLDVDMAVKVNPDQLLPTAPGLGSTSESLVPSALSSITTLSTISNVTVTNMEITENLKGFIQGTLHCQKHVLQRIPFIHNPAVYSPNSQPNKTPLSKNLEVSVSKQTMVLPLDMVVEVNPTNPATLLPIQHLSINQNVLQQNQSQWSLMQQYQYLQQRSSVSSATKSEPLPANPAFNSAVAPKSKCSADTSETVAPNATKSNPSDEEKEKDSKEAPESKYEESQGLSQGRRMTNHQEVLGMNQAQKDGKIFQNIYFRAKRGKDKGKVQIKLKRLDKPKRKDTTHQISSHGVQNDHMPISSLGVQTALETFVTSKDTLDFLLPNFMSRTNSKQKKTEDWNNLQYLLD